MNTADLVNHLRSAGIVDGDDVHVKPLSGGVSSDILLVEASGRRLVVKAALPKLRVRDEWFADVSRNHFEQAYFDYAAAIVPEAVPRILGGDADHGWFAMEYLSEPYRNWKSELLAGRADASAAELAGRTLGRLHAASWNDAVARSHFDTLQNFHALRIEPYLLTTADRVAAVRNELRAEAERLAATKTALVHGDFSPKNLLVAPGRLVVLDAECAWFGDPAFDPAFLLTHLHLKALLHTREPAAMLALVSAFWSAYTASLGARADAELEQRVVFLLLCLLLARVHGKSPAEYLTTDAQRGFITRFTVARLPHPPGTLAELTNAWRTELATL